jgi:hypothetical protein
MINRVPLLPVLDRIRLYCLRVHGEIRSGWLQEKRERDSGRRVEIAMALLAERRERLGDNARLLDGECPACGGTLLKEKLGSHGVVEVTCDDCASRYKIDPSAFVEAFSKPEPWPI